MPRLAMEPFGALMPTWLQLDIKTATIIDWLLDMPIWQLLQLGMGIWSTYAVLTGLISFLIRIRNTCARRIGNYGCIVLILALFSDFDHAINPLNLTRINLERTLTAIENKVDHFQNLADTERSDIQFMLNRMNRFEDENQRILEEFTDLKAKAYLTLTESPPKTRKTPARSKRTGKISF